MSPVTGEGNHVDRATQFAIATAAKRNSRHWKNGTVTWGDLLDWMATPDDTKECGNYVMGTLRPTTRTHNADDGPCTRLHRGKDAVVTRSALTLDLDDPDPVLPEVLGLTISHAAILHTTFQSTPDNPRYRLIIPLDREVAPDEYVAAATHVMNLLGTDNFDPSSAEPERYMFKPAAARPANFRWWEYSGPPAAADDLLINWDPDLSTAPLPSASRFKRDPFEIEGVVGAFNRAYADLQVLITEYDLPYSPAGAGRWHLVGSRAVAGMGTVADGIIYSHHANDPAYGQACTAFDLVRLHRFGELDEQVKPQTPINRLPSYVAMLDLATVDSRVTAELVGAEFAEEMDSTAQTNDWRLQLGPHLNRQGRLKDTAPAWRIILENDSVFKSLQFNEMTLRTEFLQAPPWRSLDSGGNGLSATDLLSLQAYLEETYHTQPTSRRVDWMVGECRHQRYVNPVRDWLGKLEWDKKPRLETCLPGTEDTPYNRMVARKSLVAAVARMMRPGIKWDHTLILHGKEGIGKTYWIERMSKGWTAPLGAIHQKDTLINLQRCWIATSDEGQTMRKADAEVLKEFLTRSKDTFRMPYEVEATEHPRKCVIWGTTNDEVFLRQQEGNRRFLIVRCEEKVDFTALTDEYIDQVWAEAKELYDSGEALLWLDEEESGMAAEARESFVEEGSTALQGMLSEYLNTPVPANYGEMTVEQRLDWIENMRRGFAPIGDMIQNDVCAIQLFVEALGKRRGDHTRLDLLEIGKALRGLRWIPVPSRHRIGPYGPQMIFSRPSELGDLL